MQAPDIVRKRAYRHDLDVLTISYSLCVSYPMRSDAERQVLKTHSSYVNQR